MTLWQTKIISCLSDLKKTFLIYCHISLTSKGGKTCGHIKNVLKCNVSEAEGCYQMQAGENLVNKDKRVTKQLFLERL